MHPAITLKGDVMLSRPTTDQIILDCRHELLTAVDAAVTDPTVKITIQMLENVLRNVAERAAHEIAWMREETDLMMTFANDVQAALGASAELTQALQAFDSGKSDSLHLDDVCKTYSLAGECFSVSMEKVFQASHTALHLRSREILAIRLDHENKIMGEWAFVGRG